MTNWLGGMRTTADRLYETDLIGRVAFLARRSTAQTIPSGSDASSQAIQWDQVDLDVLGGWTASQPTRWTCPRAGWWTFQGAVGWELSSGGSVRECCWYVNGGLITPGRSRPVASSAITANAFTVDARAVPRLMDVDDYVELVPAQNSGANLDLATGSYQSYMSITYSGPA